ncbi:MAG TPA: GAF domain-containing protein, partial [Thermoleophilia bacterium]|nr:GAF domain-containing protein [Thermoleophilia bacterium]
MAGTFATRRDMGRVDEWLTVTQAARFLGVATHTLRDWTSKGVIEASRTVGGHRRYRKADLERFRLARAEGDSLDDVFHRLTELSTLADVSQAVFSSLELEDLLPVVCRTLIETTGCTGAALSYLDAEAGDLVTLWDVDAYSAESGARYTLDDFPMTQRVVAQQEHYLANVGDPAVDPAERGLLESFGGRSVLILPLVYKGETIGIAECYDGARERAYSPRELALARAICDRIAVAVSNSRLYDQLRRQMDDLVLVRDTVEAIGSGQELQETLETIARHLTEAIDVAWCDIYDYDPVRKEVAVVACYQAPWVPPAADWLGTTIEVDRWSDMRRAIELHEASVVHVTDLELTDEMRAEMDRWNEKSTMTVPMVHEGELVGVLDIAESRRRRDFSGHDVHLVEAIAAQAAMVVHKMRLLDQTRRSNRELTLLLDTGEVIASSIDLPEALGKVTEWLTHALGVAWADIYEYDAAKDELDVIAFYQIEGVPSSEGWLGTSIPSDLLSDWHRSIHERQPVAIYADDPALPARDLAEMAKWNERSTLAVPLLYHDEVIGLLDVAESRYDRRFTDDDVRVASALANQLGPAVHNLRVFGAMRRRTEELAAALKISETVTSSCDVDTVLDTVVGTLREALDLSWCEIYDFDRVACRLSLAAHSYLEPLDTGGRSGVYEIGDAPSLTAAIVEKRPFVNYTDDETLSASARAEMERWGDKASLFVPMIYGGDVAGVVYGAETRELRRFTAEDVRLAMLIAAQGAAVIETTRSRARELADREQLARFNRRLESLVEFSAQMRGLVEVDVLVALLGRVVTEALELRGWAVYLYDVDRDCFTVRSDSGEGAGPGHSLSAAELADLIAGAAPISTSFFVARNEGDADGEWHAGDTLFVPLTSEKGQPLGYLEAYDPVDGRLPNEELIRHLEVFAGKAASTLELLRLHAQLEEQATTDGLTGLFNHRHVLERLEGEVAKAKRYGTPLSLLMIDIDDFKPFNDTYGHPQGDKLLREVADILRGGVRQKVDLVARYGGEEFVVLLPSTPAVGARVAAERLRGD